MYHFSEAHPSSLMVILQQVEMDVNKAAAVVHAMFEREQSGITQVCRHYLQGECRRADCMVCELIDIASVIPISTVVLA